MDLVIYDTSNGKILFQMYDETKIKECSSILVEVPSDKQLVSIDPTTKEPIFEDRPLSVEERLAQLEESQADQDGAIEELAGLVTGEE